MDLFSDFSFSKPSSRPCDQFSELAPVDRISPRSSRSTSPCSPSSPYTGQYHSSFEHMDTTNHFDLYNFNPEPMTPRSASRKSSRSLGLDQRKRNTSPRGYFDMTRSRRQSAVRQLCDPRRASAIRLYVERFLSEEQGCISEVHPSAMDQSGCPPPVTSAPSFGMSHEMDAPSPDSSSADEDGIEDFKYLAISQKPNVSGRRSSVVMPSRRNHPLQKNVKPAIKSRPRY